MEKHYELVYILRPDLEDEARSAAMQRVTQRVAEAGGTVERTDEWGKRRMTYAISNAQEGHYVLVRFTAEGGVIPELRRTLGLIEDVVRFLVVASEPEAPRAEPEAAVAAAPEGQT